MHRNLWARWAKNASEEDLLKVATDLLKTDVNDIGEILDYLTAFGERRFPLDFSKLMTLAEGHSFDRTKVAKSIRFLDKNVPNVSIDHTIRIAVAAAFKALENIGDPSVRAFAIKMIESGNNASRAIGLLTNNFRDGDWTFIQELASRPLEEEDRWILAWTVLDIFAAHPSKAAVGTFLVMYETAPCASCRLKFVETLHHLEALPDWIIEECKYDSNFDLRAKAIEYAKITD